MYDTSMKKPGASYDLKFGTKSSERASLAKQTKITELVQARSRPKRSLWILIC